MTDREILKKAGINNIPEVKDFKYNSGEYNKITEQDITRREMIYSHFNHEEVWSDFHPEYYAFSNLLKRIKNDIRKYLEAKFYYRGQGQDLSALYGQSGPAIVCGSGPSFDKVLPHLRKWKGAIFCNSSQATSLRYYGIHPTYIDIIDPRVEDWELNARFDYSKTSLIIQPCLHPRVTEQWKGKKYYFRIFEPSFPWYAKTLSTVYGQMIQTKTYPFGCMTNASLSHAHKMGYSPIFLVGTDMGYPGLITRFSKYIRERRISWTYYKKPDRETAAFIKKELEKEKLNQAERAVLHDIQKGQIRGIELGWKWVKDEAAKIDPATWDSSRSTLLIGENGVLTDHIMSIYRTQLMRVVAIDAPQVVNASEGIIPDDAMLKVDPMYAIENQDKGFEDLILPKEIIRRAAEIFLAAREIYLLTSEEGGHVCIGMTDWKKQLRDTIGMVNQGSENGKIDYDKAYRHIEEVTNGITSSAD